MNKIIVVNLSIIAIIGFLIFNNIMPVALFDTTNYPIHILLGLTTIGIILIGFNRVDDAKWLANHMTRFGMIGTLIGMIQGLTGLEFTTEQVSGMATQLAHHTGFAFYSTLLGVIGNIWLNFNLRIKGE